MSRRGGWAGALLIGGGAALLAGVALLPFRQAPGTPGEWAAALGRSAGLLAATLVLGQFLFSARLKRLDRAVGIHRLMRIHAMIGATVGVLVVIHPVLIYGSGAHALGALRWSMWPELLGITALTILAAVICTSLWRAFLLLPYEAWRHIHRLVFVAVAAVAVHAAALGPDVGVGWAAGAWILLAAGYVALWTWVKVIKPLRLRAGRFSVTGVTPLNDDVCRIDLSPTGRSFRHLPGQFAFLRFHGRDVAGQEHPFTISSASSDSGALSVTIKASGDFTRTVPKVRLGDAATVDGPYGRLSHCLHAGETDGLVLIAGGVGVTPLLSMLRHIDAVGDNRPVTLIWACRTQADLFCREELSEMVQRRLGLRMHYVLSREPDWPGESGHLDAPVLARLTPGDGRRRQVFVCGPDGMMVSVVRSLRRLGYPRRRIHTEAFAL